MISTFCYSYFYLTFGCVFRSFAFPIIHSHLLYSILTTIILPTIRLQDNKLCRKCRGFISYIKSFHKANNRIISNQAFYVSVISFFHMFPRSKKIVCQHTIICYNKQSLCILIKSTYREQISSLILSNKLNNCFVSLILGC